MIKRQRCLLFVCGALILSFFTSSCFKKSTPADKSGSNPSSSGAQRLDEENTPTPTSTETATPEPSPTETVTPTVTPTVIHNFENPTIIFNDKAWLLNDYLTPIFDTSLSVTLPASFNWSITPNSDGTYTIYPNPTVTPIPSQSVADIVFYTDYYYEWCAEPKSGGGCYDELWVHHGVNFKTGDSPGSARTELWYAAPHTGTPVQASGSKITQNFVGPGFNLAGRVESSELNQSTYDANDDDTGITKIQVKLFDTNTSPPTLKDTEELKFDVRASKEGSRCRIGEIIKKDVNLQTSLNRKVVSLSWNVYSKKDSSTSGSFRVYNSTIHGDESTRRAASMWFTDQSSSYKSLYKGSVLQQQVSTRVFVEPASTTTIKVQCHLKQDNEGETLIDSHSVDVSI